MGRLTQTAFALDAAVFDLAYITGPVLASGLATGLAPAAAVAVLLALTGAAVIIIVTPSGRPGNSEPPAAWRSRFGPLRSAALRELLITAALTNVALTAYVRHHHALWASGPLLAEVSIGSIVGSLFLGNHSHRLRRLLAGYACGLAVLTAAGSAALAGFASARPVLGLGLAAAAAIAGAPELCPAPGRAVMHAWPTSSSPRRRPKASAR